MNDDAQMIILSSMVISLCLIGLMACVASVDSPQLSSAQSTYLTHETVENVRWAQDSGLKYEAAAASTYAWQDRSKATGLFCQKSGTEAEELSDRLLRHGVSYELTLNRSLAGQYIAAHPEPDAVNIEGVLVKPASGNAKIYGCAYDMYISDGMTGYSDSRMVLF